MRVSIAVLIWSGESGKTNALCLPDGPHEGHEWRGFSLQPGLTRKDPTYERNTRASTSVFDFFANYDAKRSKYK